MDKYKKRHNSRIIAVQCLYTRIIMPEPTFDLDSSLSILSEVQEMAYDRNFVEQLVCGSFDQKEQWDDYIDAHTKYGAASFQPLERAVIWLGFYELSLSPRLVSPPIVIDEALEVLRDLSDERTRSLINGLLDRFARAHDPEQLEKKD